MVPTFDRNSPEHPVSPENSSVDVVTNWVGTLAISVDRQKELVAFYKIVAEKSPVIQAILQKDTLAPNDIEVLVKMRFLSKLLLQVKKWQEVNDVSSHTDIAKSYPPDVIKAMQAQSALASEALEHIRTSSAKGIESITLTDLMPDAFRMFGGTVRRESRVYKIDGVEVNGQSRFIGDYEVFARMEHELFSDIPPEMLRRESFYGAWEIQKQRAFDLEVKKSIGRQGLVGRFENFMEKDDRLIARGDRHLKRQLQQLERKAIKEKWKLPRPLLKLKDGPKLSFRHNGDLSDKVREILSNPEITDTRRYQDICALYNQRHIALPKKNEELLLRIQKTETLDDVTWDAKKDLKTVSIIWMLGILQPTATELIPKPGVFDVQHPIFSARNLSIIADQNPEAIESLLSDLESTLLSEVNHFPPNLIMDNLLLIRGVRRSESLEEAIEVLLHSDMASIYDRSQEEYLAVYPESVRPALLALESQVNENRQSWSEILQTAESLYLERRPPQASDHVYWTDHPEALSISGAVNAFIENPGFSVSNESFGPTLTSIYRASSDPFDSYNDVAWVFNILHGLNDNTATSEQMSVYYADYFQYIFNYAQEHQTPIPPAELLAYALLRTNGDMHLAMWDVTIATKIFTRNNLADGSFVNGRSSGWLATRYLVDFASTGATASDIAQVLPLGEYPQFTNILSPTIDLVEGTKDYDVSNEAGQFYHVMNLASTSGEFPTSLMLAGLIQEFFETHADFSEYGRRRMSDQITYVLEFSGGLNDWIDSHREVTNHRREVATAEFLILPQQPFNRRFEASSNSSPFYDAIYRGDVVQIRYEGRRMYAVLRGSEANPYILLSSTMESLNEVVPFVSIQAAQFITDQDITSDQKIEIVGTVDQAVRITPIAEDTSYILQMERLMAQYPVGDKFSTEDFQDTRVDRSLTSYFLHSANAEALRFLFAHPKLFSEFVTDDEFLTFFTNDFFDYFLPNLENWSTTRGVPIESLINMLGQEQTSWTYAVADNPKLFGPSMSVEQFDQIYNSNAFINYMKNYRIWNTYFPRDAEDLMRRIRESDNILNSVAIENIDIFAPHLTLEDFYFVLASGETAETIEYYIENKGVFTFELSDSDLYEWLRSTLTFTWGSTVMQLPEVFQQYIIPEDLPGIIRSGGTISIMENIEYWGPFFTINTESLYSAVQAAKEDWGNLVGSYPDYFAQVVSKDDLIPMIEAFGATSIVEHFDVWSVTFQITAAELETILTENYLGYVIRSYPDVFAEVETSP